MIVIQSRWPSIVGHKSVRRRCCQPPSLALIVSAGAPQLRTRPLFARAFRPAGLLAYFTPTQWGDGCQAEHVTSALVANRMSSERSARKDHRADPPRSAQPRRTRAALTYCPAIA